MCLEFTIVVSAISAEWPIAPIVDLWYITKKLFSIVTTEFFLVLLMQRRDLRQPINQPMAHNWQKLNIDYKLDYVPAIKSTGFKRGWKILLSNIVKKILWVCQIGTILWQVNIFVNNSLFESSSDWNSCWFCWIPACNTIIICSMYLQASESWLSSLSVNANWKSFNPVSMHREVFCRTFYFTV